MRDFGLAIVKREGYIISYSDGTTCYGFKTIAPRKIKEIVETMPWYLRPFNQIIVRYCHEAWEEALLTRERSYRHE